MLCIYSSGAGHHDKLLACVLFTLLVQIGVLHNLHVYCDGTNEILVSWQALTSSDNGQSTCTLLHTAMATGEKCPVNQTCISGML